jgi:predicted RNA polymerase sigma factor
MVNESIETVFRREAGRVLGTLIRLLGDFDLAEESLQEAFAAAVEQWPQSCSTVRGVDAHPAIAGELNHAAAIAMVDGPARALQLVEALLARGELKGYLLPAVHAELLLRLGRRLIMNRLEQLALSEVR